MQSLKGSRVEVKVLWVDVAQDPDVLPSSSYRAPVTATPKKETSERSGTTGPEILVES